MSGKQVKKQRKLESLRVAKIEAIHRQILNLIFTPTKVARAVNDALVSGDYFAKT